MGDQMQKCSYADKYLAVYAPQCNNGKGCEVCRMKWMAKQRARARLRVRVTK